MANSLTFAMVAAQMPPSPARAVSHVIAQYVDLLQVMPYKGTGDMFHLTRLQDVSVPTPNWRMFNDDAPNPTRGTQRVETRFAAQLDFTIKLDTSLAKIRSQWEDYRTSQVRLHVLGAAFEGQRAFFHGDPNTVVEEPAGVYNILADNIQKGYSPAAQDINATTGGAALSFDLADQLNYACFGSNRIYLSNPFINRKFYSLARDAATSGILRISEDRNMLGEPFAEYAGMKLLRIERKDTHATDLPFDEDDGSGNFDTTSLWLINFDSEEPGVYAFGPGQIGITAQPFVPVPGTPFIVSYTQWAIAWMLSGPTNMGRVKHLNAA